MLSVCHSNQVYQVCLVTMSEQVMASGVCVVEVWTELLSCGQMQVRAELSDGNLMQLNRTDEDLAQMMKRLVDGFPGDRETLSSNLLTVLLKVRAAEQSSDPEVKIVEVNKLLRTIINLPHKFSQSEAVLAFFQASALDQIVRDQQDQTVRQEDQDLRVSQRPVVLSDSLRSNGFCLANTETILFDLTPPTYQVSQSEDSSARRASVGPAVCLQLCSPSVSPHLLRGFTGMMGRLMKRRSFRCRSASPPCCSLGFRRRTSWTE